MRDIVLTAFVLGSLPFILRWAHIGVVMWVWLSVMNPHRLTWTFAHNLGFAAIVGVVTLVAFVVSRDRQPMPRNRLTLMLALLVLWTGLTSVFALFPADSLAKWFPLFKTVLMAVLIPSLFYTESRIRLLVWVLVLSVAYYGTKGGLFVLLTGGATRVYGPEGSYIADNNSLAVAIIMMIPWMRYLQLTTQHKYVRWGLTAMMLLCGLAALGSHSRGGLLAIAAMLLVLAAKTRHKLQLVFVALVSLPLALALMPENWYARMETIQDYQHERSANMRLNAWGTMFNIVKDRPLVGAGFDVAEREIYAKYAPDPTYPPQVAHSIYFEALGSHGFVGLALYLLLYLLAWRQSGALTKLSEGRLDLAWVHHFGLMMQVSLIGFLVGGAFLSLMIFDVPYYLMMMIVAVRALVERELSETERSPAPVPTGPVALASAKPGRG